MCFLNVSLTEILQDCSLWREHTTSILTLMVTVKPWSPTKMVPSKTKWLIEKASSVSVLLFRESWRRGWDQCGFFVLLWEHEVGSLIHIPARISLYPNTDSVKTTVEHDYSSNMNNKLRFCSLQILWQQPCGKSSECDRADRKGLTSLIVDPIVKSSQTADVQGN